MITAKKLISIIYHYAQETSSSSKRDHLIEVLYKRIACSCLKKMHSEARRAIPKENGNGACIALHRSWSVANVGCYCSRECQVAHWSKHRKYCLLTAPPNPIKQARDKNIPYIFLKFTNYSKHVMITFCLQSLQSVATIRESLPKRKITAIPLHYT